MTIIFGKARKATRPHGPIVFEKDEAWNQELERRFKERVEWDLRFKKRFSSSLPKHPKLDILYPLYFGVSHIAFYQRALSSQSEALDRARKRRQESDVTSAKVALKLVEVKSTPYLPQAASKGFRPCQHCQDFAPEGWSQNPLRHIHGGEREYNERRPVTKSARHIVLASEVINSSVKKGKAKRRGSCGAIPTHRTVEEKNWNGGWDNVVRALEE